MLINTTGFPQGAGFDFSQGTMPPGASIARAAGPWSRTMPNRILELGTAANTPRFDYDFNSARTNFVSNSEFTGWVAGTPGTMPGGSWSGSGANGLSREIVEVGQDQDGRFTTFRFSGTNTAASTSYVHLKLSGSNAAVPGQVWTGSYYIEMLAGSWDGIGGNPFSQTYNSGNTIANQPTGVAVANGLATVTFTVPNNAVRLDFGILIQVLAGVSVDATFRIRKPQLEMAATRSAYIPTTGTIATAASYNGLLIEPASTNFATAKVPASAAGSRMTVTTGIDDPANTTTAIRMTMDGNVDPQIGFSTAPNQAGRTFTRSMYLRDNVTLNQLSRANLYDYGTSGAETPTSTNAITGPAWNRYSGTRTFNATMNSTSAFMRVDPFEGTGGTNQPLANSSQDTAFWQYEEGTKATTYIPTTAGAATRPAETLVMNWASIGVLDGPISVLVTFDNGTTQTLSATVSGGICGLSASMLARTTVRSVTII